MALDNGWFKLYRPMLKSDIWRKSNPNHCKVLITIMSMTNFAENVAEFNGNSIVIEPNQVITSLQEIADKCGKGIDINHVRSTIKRFKKLGFITIKSTNQGSLITVSNYETYVKAILRNHKQNSKPNTKEVQASHKSDTTNKNLKNNRIEKEENAPPSVIQIEQMLNDFYYKSSPTELDTLIEETAYKGPKEKIPRIIKKFSNHYFARNGNIPSFPQIKAAFKVWLMSENNYEKKPFAAGQKKSIDLSKFKNQKR